MGFMEALRAFFGGEKLVDYPEDVDTVPVRNLEVRVANLDPDTDEKLIIIALPLAAFERVARADAPVRLAPTEGRAVTFVPVRADADPALDPNLGWIIPVTGATAAELRSMPLMPGEYELTSVHVALVVEG
ncbi:hypothetical protein G7Y29_03455 [Corynebacterium qintianiae]|uniref:Uncharacterized protein n=1 Tax=Corynebacterium qintianiae TaxID=2709392 RepID=A0A7T0PGA9_9CORY|nr:hypothetical protein [Corynebacterium qintianiae]QPK83862.1 hypothetical protein G7Y29_03455 [Corynebacterium qintianiae]